MISRRTSLAYFLVGMGSVICAPRRLFGPLFAVTLPKMHYDVAMDGSRTYRVLVNGHEVAARWADVKSGMAEIELLKLNQCEPVFYSNYGIDNGPTRIMSAIVHGKVEIIPGPPLESLMDCYRHQQTLLNDSAALPKS